ncbi:YdcF family protein [Streptomyces armeniacus]|uniref:YdcF family protein n=1 Tax=Streptomyces armeniacus TaxID=83291 RepID=A0A345Y0W2_9ACTN|nr:YdcF family protein [Streptomyces armeniacus]
MHQPARPVSAAVALGGCDLGVVSAVAEFYRAGLFPTVVFTGGSTAATRGRFPRGEAVHFREEALALGMPKEAIMLEPRATNTGQNIDFARDMLEDAGVEVRSVLLVCMPYMQRRAYATCRRRWPQVEPVCASQTVAFDEYAKARDDEAEFIAMMVGDTHRVMEYPHRGFAIPQEVPEQVRESFERLRERGYDAWLLRD